MAVHELSVAEARGHRSRGHLARALGRLVRKKIAVLSIVTLVVLYVAGFTANWIAPYEYSEIDVTSIRQPPSLDHWAGTDRAGRDVLTRVLWGVQNTAILTLVSMLTGGIAIGITLGLIAGYLGNRVDSFIMRTGEVSSSFPEIFLVIIIATTLAPRVRGWVIWLEDHSEIVDYFIIALALVILGGFWTVRLVRGKVLPGIADYVVISLALVLVGGFGTARLVGGQIISFEGLVRAGIPDYFVVSLALVSFGWIGMARLVRGQILYLKETQHVQAARAIGASTARIMFVHLLPNAISPIVVSVSFGMGAMALTELILSWLGLGIQPPRPSLGVLMFEGGRSITFLRSHPWLLLAPGLAAWMVILAWNLLGDALNDVLNPRTR